MSNEKCRFIELFMTQNDEKMFCEKYESIILIYISWILVLLRKLILVKEYIRLL